MILLCSPFTPSSSFLSSFCLSDNDMLCLQTYDNLVYKNEFYGFLIKKSILFFHLTILDSNTFEIRFVRAFFLLTLFLAHKSEETGKNMRKEWKRSLFFFWNLLWSLIILEYPDIVIYPSLKTLKTSGQFHW